MLSSEGVEIYSINSLDSLSESVVISLEANLTIISNVSHFLPNNSFLPN